MINNAAIGQAGRRRYDDPQTIISNLRNKAENSNKPHGFGRLNPESFTPFPKNPVIASFFRQIGQADELGSGMRKMMKYGKSYGGEDPQLMEGDVFRMIVKVPEFDGEKAGAAAAREFAAPVGAQVEAQVAMRILTACMDAPLSSGQIAAALGHKTLSGNLRKAFPVLREHGLIEYTLPEKPTSRLQKYRLTEKGRALLAKQKREDV